MRSREPAGVQSPDAAAGDVADAICETIAAAVADRALEPGTKLPEDTIGEHFRVSRTVVRTALSRLQRERLVELHRNRGAFVARPSIEEAWDVLDARRGLERAIIERVARRIAPADLAPLDAHIDRELAAHAARDRHAMVRLSGEFHLRLGRLAGNGVLAGFLELLVRRSALVIALYGDGGHDECGAHDHRRLVEALGRGDADEAARLLDEHLAGIQARMRLDPDHLVRRTLSDVLVHYAAPSPDAA